MYMFVCVLNAFGPGINAASTRRSCLCCFCRTRPSLVPTLQGGSKGPLALARAQPSRPAGKRPQQQTRCDLALGSVAHHVRCAQSFSSAQHRATDRTAKHPLRGNLRNSGSVTSLFQLQFQL